jgi:hypothetical protein
VADATVDETGQIGIGIDADVGRDGIEPLPVNRLPGKVVAALLTRTGCGGVVPDADTHTEQDVVALKA